MSKHKEIDSKLYDPQKDIIEKICQIEGDWTSYLDIESQRYWTVNDDLVYLMADKENPLPSDSRFRLDSLFLRLNDETQAQNEKEILEDLQRKDKDLRHSQIKTEED